MWDCLKSILPWHTTHKMDLDAKGVPKEFKVHVPGLSDISRVRVDVRESTRDAWICLIYSASFFLVAAGVSLLLGPVSWLMTSTWGLLGVMASELGVIISLFSSGLKLWGYWNSVMILCMVIAHAFHNPNKCGCPYYREDVGKYPFCVIIWDSFFWILVAQLVYKLLSMGVGMLL